MKICKYVICFIEMSRGELPLWEKVCNINKILIYKNIFSIIFAFS
jgi:hypothetical protein